jgi:hypothetical protein
MDEAPREQSLAAHLPLFGHPRPRSVQEGQGQIVNDNPSEQTPEHDGQAQSAEDALSALLPASGSWPATPG